MNYTPRKPLDLSIGVIISVGCYDSAQAIRVKQADSYLPRANVKSLTLKLLRHRNLICFMHFTMPPFGTLCRLEESQVAVRENISSSFLLLLNRCLFHKSTILGMKHLVFHIFYAFPTAADYSTNLSILPTLEAVVMKFSQREEPKTRRREWARCIKLVASTAKIALLRCLPISSEKAIGIIHEFRSFEADIP
jgi:hypothetical protein